MNKCFKITCFTTNVKKSLEEFILNEAKKLSLEGLATKENDQKIKIFVSGQEENVEQFIDALYSGSQKHIFKDITVEVDASDKSFRGVFRIAL